MSDAPRLRIISANGFPSSTQILLGDEMVPGVQRITIDIDAKTGVTDVQLHFAYVDLDITLPGVGATHIPWMKREDE